MKTEYAFPFAVSVNSSIGKAENTGMTLRDYFAAHVIQNSHASTENPWTTARWAYKIADAMLEVRDEANK